MELATWMVTGALLGWAGCTYFRVNKARGVLVSAIIGAMGGMVGGKLVAPMFVTAAVASDFSTPTLIVATGVAAGFLVVGNLVYDRWGV